MSTLGTFFLQEDRLDGARLYKVYITETALCAALVGGKYMPRQSAEKIAKSSGMDMMGIVEVREQNELLYDPLDPESPQFLQENTNNFVLRNSDVSKVSLRRLAWLPKLLTKGSGRIGNLSIYDPAGKRRHFSVFSEHDLAQAASLVKRVFHQAEVPTPN